MTTPFEIFRQHAELTRVDNPIYKKVWKPKPSRAIVPIPRQWWSRYGCKWELDIVEVTMTAQVRNGSIRIPIMPRESFSAYLAQDYALAEAVRFQVRTYDFQTVRLVEHFTAFGYRHQLAFHFSGFEEVFWRTAEPLINEGTRVTTI